MVLTIQNSAARRLTTRYSYIHTLKDTESMMISVKMKQYTDTVNLKLLQLFHCIPNRICLLPVLHLTQ